MSFRASEPVGAILAGGRGLRLGGSKATVSLNGRPMITYPLRAVQAVLGGAVILAKADSELPAAPGVEVWLEPDHPRHPLTGLVHALGMAGGCPVLVCACDLPLVAPALIRALVEADPGPSPAVVAAADGRLQPLLGCYQAAALAPLAATLRAQETIPVTEAVASLAPRCLEVSDPALLFNVNTPEDLLRAGTMLSAQPKVKS